MNRPHYYKEELRNLFKEEYRVEPVLTHIAGGGSSREYYRLRSGDISVIGTIGESRKENEVFIALDNCFKEHAINVPSVIKVSKDLMCYLLEDLGDVSLFYLLKGENRIEFAKKALSDLVKIQTISEEQWKNKVSYKPFSERLVKWDLNYFKYDFLKPAQIDFDEEKLEDDFERLTQELISKDTAMGLMYRDFQSRNIMAKNEELYFIDFQGARKGPLVYDAASFIWQAKAPFTFPEREELERYYLNELKKRNIIVSERELKSMILFRALQVLGAYGFRGLIEKKSHFIESIPYAITNLSYLKESGVIRNYPEIEKIIDRLKEKSFGSDNSEEGILTLKIFSFSYKKGYPEDNSGNGGGFMFDCRAIHNPGRYEEYKQMTGRDQEVIDFLEKTNEASEFVKNAINIVSPSIERYLKRGFTSLVVGFGCTGGQHRSVYCAEKFGYSISRKFPEIKVIIRHREQKF